MDTLESIGFDRADARAAKQAMEACTGRRSTKNAPYTIEEFYQPAEQLRERSAGEVLELLAGEHAKGEPCVPTGSRTQARAESREARAA